MEEEDSAMPRLFKRSHRYNVAKNTLLAKIILLDNTTIDFNPLPEVTGADCLEKVAQTLDIQEVGIVEREGERSVWSVEEFTHDHVKCPDSLVIRNVSFSFVSQRSKNISQYTMSVPYYLSYCTCMSEGSSITS